MTMSKDRVRFILPPRYFQKCPRRTNGFARNTMQKILHKAFGMVHTESGNLMDHNWNGGFEIECRPSQFARFIVLRYEANEGINGVRDLEPRIIQPPKLKTLYEQVGDHIGVDSHIVKIVALALAAWNLKSSESTVIDVSQRPA